MQTIRIEPKLTGRGKRCLEWIEALGADPLQVVAPQHCIVRNDEVFLLMFDGTPGMRPTDQYEEWQPHNSTDSEVRKHWATFPLTVAPAVFGLCDTGDSVVKLVTGEYVIKVSPISDAAMAAFLTDLNGH